MTYGHLYFFIPCDDVLGRVEDLMAGFGGLVSAKHVIRETNVSTGFCS